MRWLPIIPALFVFSQAAQADNYYYKKWFDIPDIGTTPRVTVGCAHKICTKIPVSHGMTRLPTMEQQCLCTNPTVKTDLLRRDVYVVVSGPHTADQAVRNALEGYAAGCVAGAIASSTAGPQVIASPAGFFAAFKACIIAISVSGIAGSIMNQFDIHFNTSQTHWSPL